MSTCKLLQHSMGDSLAITRQILLKFIKFVKRYEICDKTACIKWYDGIFLSRHSTRHKIVWDMKKLMQTCTYIYVPNRHMTSC